MLFRSPPVTRTLGEEIEDLSIILAQVDAQAKRAFAAGDISGGCALVEQTKAISERRKTAQVELRRQGKTEDDSIPRSEFERLAHAIAHHALVALQRMAVEAVTKLEGIEAPGDKLRVLEAVLLPAAYVRPFELALNLDAGHGLPSWAVESVHKAMGGNLE